MDLTPERRALLSSVNRRINAAMIATTDQQAFGQNEYWAMPLTGPDRQANRGRPLADCEDFALEKREALIRAGIPVDSLYLAVGHTERLGRHAVLVVATDQGDLVLDNLNDWVLGWERTGYTWLSRQISTSMLDWASAGDRVAPDIAGELMMASLGLEPSAPQQPAIQLAALDTGPVVSGPFDQIAPQRVGMDAIPAALVDVTPHAVASLPMARPSVWLAGTEPAPQAAVAPAPATAPGRDDKPPPADLRGRQFTNQTLVLSAVMPGTPRTRTVGLDHGGGMIAPAAGSEWFMTFAMIDTNSLPFDRQQSFATVDAIVRPASQWQVVGFGSRVSPQIRMLLPSMGFHAVHDVTAP
jgi:predicted transglutaminase-like cysteine proteinase